MNHEIGIVDVAKAAGVSIATVSNVINGKGRVSGETRRKVERIIAELGYTPNLPARHLKTNRSDLIGVVVPTMQPGRLQDNPFYWDLLAGVEEGARDGRYHVILTGIDEERETLAFVKERRLDGLIVVGAGEGSPLVPRVAALGVPAVFIDSYLRSPELNQVVLDDRSGAHAATAHLIGLGHRRIALLTGDMPPEQLPYFGVLYERLLGYRDALEEAGLPYEGDLLLRLPTSLEGGFEAARHVAALPDVTAAFAFSDVMAMGLVKGLREQGKRVPHDYSVVGFDNLFVSEYTAPALTTVSQDILAKGRVAVRMLLGQIDGVGDPARRIVLPAELIVRETTGPAGAANARNN
ncbi:LacI family DNA-binding transcriptional regulator [Paenibacillus sp. IB182496]|uniref:LacI family DNA-binding transcriptional regulator n=1 Tax=Paenibacillus sabuli TaxID=2772509 RepID=A0A927BXE5_9BACL|nr:LacI family DNA-binding transcriptional regulator [Paenibacillus sabuli]MBD2847103.1 LacI family DNA-binding transcriptional regulator [Paenibacillus sabuli]